MQRQRYRIFDAADRPDRGGLRSTSPTWSTRQPWLDEEPVPGVPVDVTAQSRHERARSSSAPGPNGLACAATLAARGVEVTVIEAAETIGGGTRSSELTLPGPDPRRLLGGPPDGRRLAGAGRRSSLERHGLEWAWPEVDLAHPLDDGSAARDGALDRGDGGGPRRRRRAPGGGSSAPPSRGFDALSEDILRPVLHLPRHPLRLARFGLRAALPATALARAPRQRRRRGRCSAASPPTPSAR